MRSTLDRLISIGGLVLAIVLLVAGGLLLWANIYITNEVHDQLAAQKITMPTDETGLADLPADDKAALEPYAGQPMTTGSQARAYADHFIAVHLSEVATARRTRRSAASTSLRARTRQPRRPPTARRCRHRRHAVPGRDAAWPSPVRRCFRQGRHVRPVRRDRRARGRSGAAGARLPGLPARPEVQRRPTRSVT